MLNEAAELSTQVNLDPCSEYDNNMAREEPEQFKRLSRVQTLTLGKMAP